MDFNKLVKIRVEPILLFFGFTIKRELKGIIEYNHKHLVIVFSYDYSNSYEVDITLLFKENNMFYGYDELKEYFYNQKANFSATQLKNEDIIKEWFVGVKKFFEENLNNIIANRQVVQIGLQKIRQHRIANYEKERKKKILNKAIEKYWMEKDYFGLVKFLKNSKGELEGSIKKKYEYSLKMINRKI